MYDAKMGQTAGAVPDSAREVRPGRATHLVKPGETLASIASIYGAHPMSLIALNSHQIGSEGNGLHAGQRLEI